MTEKIENNGREAPGSIRDMQLFEEIGETDDSILYRARREGKDYAVRVSRERAAADSEAVQRFRRDAAIRASLQHPLIPTSYDVGVSEGRPYIVIEHIEGQNLTEWLDGEPLSERMAVVIAGAVAGALAHVHDEGLIHGNVVPEGIVLTEAGEIKLLDRGLTSPRGEVRGNGDAVGNIRYAAPEQVGLLDRPVDGRADLFALGVVLFESVAGRPPSQLVEGSEILNNHYAVAPPPLGAVTDEVTPAFGAIVDKLLEGDPDDRYQSARRLRTDLHSLDSLNERIESGFSLGLGSQESSEVEDDESQFVGRRQELDQIEQHWNDVRDGKGNVLLVEGPSGSGKTRLQREVERKIVGDGNRVVYGGCLESSPIPFAPLRHGLDRYVTRLEGSRENGDGRAAELLASAAGRFGGLLQTVSPRLAEFVDDDQVLLAEDSHEVFYSAFASFFLQLGDELDGAILWIDDAQWMGQTTFDVLRNLGSQIHDHQLLLICSMRNEQRYTGALERLRDQIGVEEVTRIALDPFDNHDVGQLIGNELGVGEAEGAFVDELTRQSRGNPFVVQQQLRVLRDDGLIAPNWGTWTVDDDRMSDVEDCREPTDWIVHSVDKLDPEVRRVLSVGAVLGVSFSLSQIESVCNEHEMETIHRAIQGGIEAEFLRRDSDTKRYTFAHDRIREVMLLQVDHDRETRRIHRRAAEYLDELGELSSSETYRRARHFMASAEGEADPAFRDALLEAAEMAVDEHAFDDAYEFLTGIAAHTHPDSLDEPGHFYEMFGSACFRTGRLEEAVEHYEQALQEATDALRRAKLRAGIAQARVHGLDEPRARVETTKAFDELDINLPTSHGSAKPIVLARLAIHWLVSMFLMVTGFRAGRAEGRERTRYQTLVNLYDVGFHVGYYGRDKLFLLQSAIYGLRPVHYLGASREYSIGLSLYSMTLGLLGAQDAADKYGQRALRNAERVADRQALAFTRQMYGTTKGLCGELDETIEIGRELLESDPEWLDLTTFNHVCIDLSAAYLFRGEAKKGYELNRMVLRRLEHAGGPLWSIYRTRACAMVMVFAAMLGRVEESRRMRRRMIEVGEGLERDRTLPWLSIWGLDALQCYYRGQVDDDFEEAIRRHDAFEIPAARAVHHSKHCYLAIAYGTLHQADDTPEGSRRVEILRELEHAIADLEEVSTIETLQCHLLAIKGGFRRLKGEWSEAEEILELAEERSLRDGNVWARFEAIRHRAMLLRERRMDGAARRTAREAYDVAADAGWRLCAQRLAESFDLELPDDREPEAQEGELFRPDPMEQPVSASSNLESRDLAALASMTFGASSERSSEGKIREVLDGVVHYTNATRVFLYARHPDSGEPVSVGGRDRVGFDLDSPEHIDHELLRRAFDGEESIVSGKVDIAEEAASDSICILSLPPLFAENRAFAAIYIENLSGRSVSAEAGVDDLMALAISATGILSDLRSEYEDVSSDTPDDDHDD